MQLYALNENVRNFSTILVMTALRTWLQIYGAINIVGGIIGFVAAHSNMSLMVGGSLGLLIIVLAQMTLKIPSLFRVLGLLVFGLGCFWIYRAIGLMAEGKSIMMSLGNILLAVGTFVWMGLAHMSATRDRKLTEQAP